MLKVTAEYIRWVLIPLKDHQLLRGYGYKKICHSPDPDNNSECCQDQELENKIKTSAQEKHLKNEKKRNDLLHIEILCQ